MKRVITSVLSLSALLCISLTGTAHAVESFGVGARPANPREDNPRTKSIFVYDLSASQSKKDAITVSNNTQERKVINVYPVDSQRASDGAFACEQAADTKDGVGTWITLQTQQITLDANQQRTIPFTITAPANVDAGEQNGCIAIQAIDATAPPDQNGIALSFRSALRVAITVPGDLKTQLRAISSNIAIDKTIIRVSPTYKNEGNVSVDATIKTNIRNIFNTELGSTEGTFPVLRNSEGVFNFELKRPFWGGYYWVQTEANYKSLSQENGKLISTGQTSERIFVMPMPKALVIEVSAIAIALLAIATAIYVRRLRSYRIKFSKQHTIKSGENIQQIAKDYNTSWKLVARMNNLKAPYILTKGDKIIIPPKRKVKKTKQD